MTWADITKVVEHEKFIEHRRGRFIVDRNNKRLIKGTFKDTKTGVIYNNDEFMAYELSKRTPKGNKRCSALEVYETYIDYFNYTSQDGEKREAISAEWVNEEASEESRPSNVRD